MSELVTNVVVHAATTCTLALDVLGDHLVVEVADEAAALPPAYGPRPLDTAAGGRGLRLVEALAPRWGVRTEQDHKCVWFAMPAHPPIPGRDGASNPTAPASLPAGGLGSDR